jgi:hypothetical protein
MIGHLEFLHQAEGQERFEPGLTLKGVLADGSSTFIQSPVSVGSGRTFYTAVLDANGDGHSDIYACSGPSAVRRSNQMFLGDGAGGFAEVTTGPAVNNRDLMPSTYGQALCSHVAVLDANDDDWPDLVCPATTAKLNRSPYDKLVPCCCPAQMSSATQHGALILPHPPPQYVGLDGPGWGYSNQLFIGTGNGNFGAVTVSSWQEHGTAIFRRSMVPLGSIASARLCVSCCPPQCLGASSEPLNVYACGWVVSRASRCRAGK